MESLDPNQSTATNDNDHLTIDEQQPLQVEDDSEEREEIEFNENAEEIDLVHQRLTEIGDLSFFKCAKVLDLRWNLLTKIVCLLF
uniref:Uncharacterized protein n=1 Tax=Panagrolaimus davidi TaxID=227884 RepID=A0A914QHJ9_9BILA